MLNFIKKNGGELFIICVMIFCLGAFSIHEYFTIMHIKYGDRVDLGVVEDIRIVPTSFNESTKVAVKTNTSYIVLGRVPKLNFGDTLWGSSYNGELLCVYENSGCIIKVKRN